MALWLAGTRANADAQGGFLKLKYGFFVHYVWAGGGLTSPNQQRTACREQCNDHKLLHTA